MHAQGIIQQDVAVRYPDQEPGKAFKIGLAARVVAEYGEDVRSVENQFRAFVQRGYVQPRGRAGSSANAAALFAEADLLAAFTLRAITRLGNVDSLVSRAASDAMYQWESPEDAVRGDPGAHQITHPATAAIRAFERGENRILRAFVTIDPDTARRDVVAWIEAPEAPAPVNEGVHIVGLIAIPLSRFIARIIATRAA